MKKRSKNKKKTAAPEAPARVEAVPARAEAVPAKAAPAHVVLRREPSLEEIRARAYQRFLNRGGAPGRMIEDWLAAERELKAERN